MEQIAKAFNKFQNSLPEVKLDATVKVQTKKGGSYDFKYATLANIIKTALPVLVKNGLSFSQTFENGSLCTTLYHISGEKIKSSIPLDLSNATMQEIGSRISYLKRYSLSALLGIVAEEDDDANIADGNAYQTQRPEQSDKPKSSETKSENEMTVKQWDFIKKLGQEKELTEKELVDMIKWLANREGLDPRHWKIAKMLIPMENFETVFTQYCEWHSERNNDDQYPF